MPSMRKPIPDKTRFVFMPSSILQNLKVFFVGALLITGAMTVSGCQNLIQDVEAVLQHDDVPKFSLEQQDAFRAFEANRFDEAIALFQSAIDIESDPILKAKLYNGLGSSLNQLDRYGEAITAYEQALSLAPEKAQVWVNLGVTQRLAGNYEQALTAYKEALKRDANLATAHSSIGSLLVLQNKPKPAVEAFNSAIAIDANMAVSHGNLALAFAMLGRFEEAQSSLRRAIELGYDNGDVIQEKINGYKNPVRSEGKG